MSGIIKLAKKDSSNKSIDNIYKSNYKQWKVNLEKNKTPYFMLSKVFDKHLREITSGALKLYLYYGFHSKNDTGVSWHSIETISDYFQVSEKTINNWNKELIERGLIHRDSKDNRRNKMTYLLPLSMVLYEDIYSIEEYKGFEIVNGKIVDVYHLFQWRKNDDVNDVDCYNVPYNLFIIVLKNEHGRITCLKYIDENYLNSIEGNIYSDICKFDSDYKFNDLVIVKGIAVNSKINLKKFNILYNLLNELIDENTDLDSYPKVNLVNT
ncbi:helix-turn-helix domain-containing protein [uncultured Clostridium sp.]|uniref:helix-turn-helix domain-containing protein n=1 Tax=uncultured Clostridium sp. TaxID=59620 RepID=UPI0025EE6098|nr:helix-turn-helix domain-containing protein [uncultured Clostridium sp.]